MRLTILICLFLAAMSPAMAQSWGRYENARFGYAVEVPPGFVGQGEAANGDGQVFVSADGTQEFRVFGGNALDGFEQRVVDAMGYARDDGWTLSYERTTPSWASFSGTRNGLIVYARAIALCGGDQFASFQLIYPERDLDALHATIERLVASQEATGNSASC